jgi:hypothetical protein
MGVIAKSIAGAFCLMDKVLLKASLVTFLCHCQFESEKQAEIRSRASSVKDNDRMLKVA